MTDWQAEHPVQQLLLRVQDELRSRLDPSVFRPADVFLTVFDDVIPVGTRCPAIGIKDGGSTVAHGTCQTDLWTVNVQLMLVESGLGAADSSIAGSSSQPGVLGMEREVQRILRGRQLGCLEGGWQVSSGEPSRGAELNGQDVQVKKITFQYIVEDKWPVTF